MTPGLAKVAASFLSRFCLVLVISAIITAFVIGRWLWFDSTRAYLAHCRSEAGDCLSADDVHRWFQYSFADGRVQDLAEAVLPSRRREASLALGANRSYAAQAVVWVVSTAEPCSLTRTVPYMCLLSQVDPGVVDLPPILERDFDIYDVGLDAEGK